MKDSVWRFDKIISITIYFYKTVELNGTFYVKLPLKRYAIKNIENVDKYCFLWSILARLQHCKNSHQKECDTYILRSLNHEMYLRKIKKSTLSLFDDKRS